MNKIKTILIATSNIGKVKEIKNIIENMNLNNKIRLLTLKDLELSNLKPVEDGKTFYQNAYKKAVFYYEKATIPVLAEDSGLVVPSLNGEPGVLSAIYASENATDEENRRYLLEKMKDKKDRSAYFEACCLFFDGINVICKEGRCYGYITEYEIGKNGFGYDPIFFSPELNKTFGEATEEEKNLVSHRAIAIRNIFEELNFLELI